MQVLCFLKQCRVRFTISTNISKDILEQIHVDLWGLATVSSNGGARYFVSLIDEYSRRLWVFFMKHKLETSEMFVNWKTIIEKKTWNKIKYLRSDNSREFCSGNKYWPNNLIKSLGNSRLHGWTPIIYSWLYIFVPNPIFPDLATSILNIGHRDRIGLVICISYIGRYIKDTCKYRIVHTEH